MIKQSHICHCSNENGWTYVNHILFDNINLEKFLRHRAMKVQTGSPNGKDRKKIHKAKQNNLSS